MENKFLNKLDNFFAFEPLTLSIDDDLTNDLYKGHGKITELFLQGVVCNCKYHVRMGDKAGNMYKRT